MELRKITSADMQDKGNIGKADTPGVTTLEMQRIMDELVREVVVPIQNENIDTLTALEIDKRVHSTDVKKIRVNSDKQIEVSIDGTSFEAAGSSGHLVLDKDGRMMPQRGRLKFIGETIVTDDAPSNTTCVKGIKGEQGEQGMQGIQGVQGVQGDDGKVYLPTVTADGIIRWQLVEDDKLIPQEASVRGPQGVQGIQGPQGVQGEIGVQGQIGHTGEQGEKGEAGVRGKDGERGLQGERGAEGLQGASGETGATGADGRNFTIKGRYNTITDLQADYPVGAAGDAWIVGSVNINTVYIWDMQLSVWVNIGAIQGPKGNKGDKGSTGERGVIGITGERGIQGEKGNTGLQGVQGVKGEKGNVGPRGLQGIQGVQGEFGIQGHQGVQGFKGADGDMIRVGTSFNTAVQRKMFFKVVN